MMLLSAPRERITVAGTRIDAAYLLLQQALGQVGPFPRGARELRALAAREDALAAAVEDYGAVLREALAVFSRMELRPPF